MQFTNADYVRDLIVLVYTVVLLVSWLVAMWALRERKQMFQRLHSTERELLRLDRAYRRLQMNRNQKEVTP